MQNKDDTYSPHPANKCRHCRIAHLCLPSGIDKRALKTVTELQFTSRLLDPGEHLIRQGEKSASLFLIRSGLLKSYFIRADGHEFIMNFHLPPELFGWEGTDETQRSYAIMALDFTNVCEIPLAQLTSLTQTHPEIQQQLYQFITQRISHDNTAFLRTTAQQRVVSFLLNLARQYKRLGYPYYLCRLVMTHQDIANYLRIAPETISRIFKNLQKEELITVHKKKIYLNNIKALEVIASGEKAITSH